MRIKSGLLDVVLLVAVATLFFLRNWQAAVVIVLAYGAFRYYKSKKGGPPADSNEFLIENKDKEFFTAGLGVGLDYRSMPNFFRTDYRFDTCQSKSLYEYRLEGSDVLCRLIEDKHSDIGVPEYRDVRDGVVLESEIRKRDAERQFHVKDVEETIASLKKDTEWHRMDSMSWHGLKYFIVSKKLSQVDARRYLRQELERLKAGVAAVFKEAEKYGLEHDEEAKYFDRLKVSERKPTPSAEEFRKLFASAESFGISELEFSWGKKLTGVIEKLLDD